MTDIVKTLEWKKDGKFFTLGGNRERAVYIRKVGHNFTWFFDKKCGFSETIEEAFEWVEALTEQKMRKHLLKAIRPEIAA